MKVKQKIGLEELAQFSLNIENIVLKDKDYAKLKKCRSYIEKLINENKTMYGVNTGFGELARIAISKDKLEELQKNIILSHSVGNGKKIEKEYIRGALFLKLMTFLKGNSGVTKELAQLIVNLLNRDLIPVTYEGGSLGASGDLIPFAHMFATLFGKGEFYYKGKIIKAAEGLKLLKIKKFSLKAKEGLALTNGMQFSATIGGLNLFKLKSMLLLYTHLMGLWFELEDINRLAFRNEVYELRPFKGIKIFLDVLKKSLAGISIDKSRTKVQDPYTIRCVPQVIGGIIDNLLYVQKELEVEFNSVSDNPLFIPEKELYLSTGNFHGESIGIALDSAAISTSVLLSLIERQSNRLINPNISRFPPFLLEKPGLNSGFMLVQYSLASLANRNSVLATPASVYNIPVSGDQEDFVSMAGNSALKFRDSVNNLEEAMSLFVLTLYQAYYLSKKDIKGKKNLELTALMEKYLKPVKRDIYLKDEMEKARKIVIEYYKKGNGLF
ncbi:aromatic amino acid lyase [bacterium]|nr:aromatic amino acid lyase [bacterium]